jgi:hypothetical protein
VVVVEVVVVGATVVVVVGATVVVVVGATVVVVVGATVVVVVGATVVVVVAGASVVVVVGASVVVVVGATVVVVVAGASVVVVVVRAVVVVEVIGLISGAHAAAKHVTVTKPSTSAIVRNEADRARPDPSPLIEKESVCSFAMVSPSAYLARLCLLIAIRARLDWKNNPVFPHPE